MGLVLLYCCTVLLYHCTSIPLYYTDMLAETVELARAREAHLLDGRVQVIYHETTIRLYYISGAGRC